MCLLWVEDSPVPLSGARSNPTLVIESTLPFEGTRTHPMVIDGDEEEGWWSLPSLE